MRRRRRSNASRLKEEEEVRWGRTTRDERVGGRGDLGGTSVCERACEVRAGVDRLSSGDMQRV